jgi:ubiquinone/menaquinone biosynthesis C-methylase UbiE
MTNFNRKYIKNKIIQIDPKRWWGDDFDVRFYLISKLLNLEKKKILDIGGGIGIISSEIPQNNFRVNLDLNFDDLKTCGEVTDSYIDNVCASMKDIPFSDNSFDVVVSSSVLQYAKSEDMKLKKMSIIDNIQTYPTVEKCIKEIIRVLKPNGKLFLVTQNNSYYNSYMLNYDELQYSINKYFSNVDIGFYNTYHKILKDSRKLNMANVIPKLLSRIKDDESIIQSLYKTKSKNNYSVSFFVEASKKDT